MEDNSVMSTVLKGVNFVLGTFLLALSYNIILLPQGFAFAGMSGISIALRDIPGFNPTLFIYIANTTCLLLSFLLLGWNRTKNTIIGSLLYPVMITFTLPIAVYLSQLFMFDDMIVTAICAAILYGTSNGIIYKCGFTTGGNDVLMQILNKYLRVPESKGLLLVNGIVILCGVYAFGLEKGIYSLLIMLLSSIIIDKIMYGISDSKIFYIYSKKTSKLKKVILDEYKSGYTILPTKGGYSHENGYLIMVVVPNRYYYSFKKSILEIDPRAFFIIEDCYEVNGGVKKSKSIFMR